METWSDFDWGEGDATAQSGGDGSNSSNDREAHQPHQQQTHQWTMAPQVLQQFDDAQGEQEQRQQHQSQLDAYYPEERLPAGEPIPFHSNLFPTIQQQQVNQRQADGLFDHLAGSQKFHPPPLYKCQQQQDHVSQSDSRQPVGLDSLHEPMYSSEQAQEIQFQQQDVSSSLASSTAVAATAPCPTASIQPTEDDRHSLETSGKRDSARANDSLAEDDDTRLYDDEPARKKMKGGHSLDDANQGHVHSLLASQGGDQQDGNAKDHPEFAQAASAASSRKKESLQVSFLDEPSARDEMKSTFPSDTSTPSFPDRETAENINELINGLCDDATARESFASGVNAAVSFHAATTLNDISVAENTPGREEAKALLMRKEESGIFDDAEDDIELPSGAFSLTMAAAGAAAATATAPSTTQEGSTGTSSAQNDMCDPIMKASTSLQKSSTTAEKGRTLDRSTPAEQDEEKSGADVAVLDDGAINATSSSKTSAESKAKKVKPKTKPKPKPLKKPIAEPTSKETKTANALLRGKTDLSLVLPANACWFLGREFWIFTVQQLESLFDQSLESYSAPGMAERREEILHAMTSRVVCAEQGKTSFALDGDAPQKKAYSRAPTALEAMLDAPLAVRKDWLSNTKQTASSQSDGAVSVRLGMSKGIAHGPLRHFVDASDKDVEMERGDTSVEQDPFRVKSGDSVPEKDQPTDDVVSKSPEQTCGDAPVTNEPPDPCRSSQGIMVVPAREKSSHIQETLLKSSDDAVSILPGDAETKADTQRALASRILESWMKSAAKWRSDSPPLSEEETLQQGKVSFSLQGPVGVLLPEIVLNFLSSISVSTIFEFLSVRFTEASPGIHAMTVWRKLCGLDALKPSPLARHMAGLVTRIDTALASVPPADSYTRTWLGTALACLTATSKDFLIGECKLRGPDQFLNEMTKTFSDRLVEWRELKQLSVLKGSGKVAMVSSWKAAVRESLAAESTTEKGAGRVTTEDEIVALSQSLSSIDHAPDRSDSVVQAKPAKPTKPAMKKKKKTKEEDPDLTEEQRQMKGLALKSTDFLQKVLRADNAEFLAKMDIRTPEQLLKAGKAEDSPLVLELVKWKMATTGEEAQASSIARLIRDWALKVKQELKRFAVGETKETSKKRGHSFQLENKEASLKWKRPIEGKVDGRTRPVSRKSLSDPLDALSATALKFLASIGITTGDGFLSTRTSDMANALPKWREEQEMVALKGSGHSATISGWKATVRKAAEMMGNENIAEREATEPVESKRSKQDAVPPPPTIDYLSHPRLLEGNPLRSFRVRDSYDPLCIYEFQLSVRKGRNGFNVHLTYRGASRARSPIAQELHRSSSTAGGSVSIGATSRSFLPVLQEVAVSEHLSFVPSTDTFLASRPGCGFIEIGKYGATPLCNEEPNFLSRFDQFLLNKREKPKQHNACQRRSCSDVNVLVEESPECGSQCFFYASEPLEKGQVVELQFSSYPQHPNMSRVAEAFVAVVERLVFVRKVSSLSFSELRTLVDRMSRITSSTKSDVGKEAISLEQRNDEQQQDSNEAEKLQITRRRIHWLALQILHYLDGSKRKPNTAAEQQTLADDTRNLLMTTDERLSFCSLFDQSGDSAMLEELSNEILYDAVLNNKLGQHWSEKSTWCGLSTSLLKRCLRKASVCLMKSWLQSAKSKNSIGEIETLVFESVKRVISWERDLTELAFEVEPDMRRDSSNTSVDRSFFVHNNERLPKDVVAEASLDAAYADAMELCNEFAYEDRIRSALRDSAAKGCLVVATTAPWQQDSPIMRTIEDVRGESASLNVKWYIENQILSVVHAVASNELVHWGPESTEPGTGAGYSYVRLAGVARRILEADPTDERRPSPEQTSFESTSGELMGVPGASSSPANQAVPNTLPLFLAIVWPNLRRVYGWSMEVGEDPNDVSFYPPELHGPLRRASERQLSMQRLERARKRVKLQQQVREVGFGELPRLTKRMFISLSRNDLESGNDGVSVKTALKDFVRNILSELPRDHDAECRRRMTIIEEAVGQFFDELIPSMPPVNNDGPHDSASLECAYLMQVLLVLPSLLEQSGLPMRQIEDTLGVVRDLAQFLSSKNEELFQESLRVSHEEYEHGPGSDPVRPFLAPRMLTLLSTLSTDGASKQNCEELELVREVITPEDMKDLSGFIGTVLSQFVPCRATELDILKGRKTIHVGYPGMMCRHCASAGNEGKFFFKSLESLNTSATSILGHVYKCPLVPGDLKKTIAALKIRHAEERQHLKRGAQAAFFSRLWKRLWTNSGDIHAPVVLANHRSLVAEEGHLGTPTDELPHHDDEAGPSLKFKDHTDLLNYISTKSPWSEKRDLSERIRMYYDCISFGGELYHTKAMPKEFNAEWILHKRVPPELLSTKRLFFSG